MVPWSATTLPHDLTGLEGQPSSTVELPPHEEAEELSGPVTSLVVEDRSTRGQAVGPRSAKMSPHDLTGPEGQPLTMVDSPPHPEAEERSRVLQDASKTVWLHGGRGRLRSASRAASEPHGLTEARPHVEGS